MLQNLLINCNTILVCCILNILSIELLMTRPCKSNTYYSGKVIVNFNNTVIRLLISNPDSLIPFYLFRVLRRF